MDEAGRAERLGDLLREVPKRGAQPTHDANGSVLVINSQQIHADQIDTESRSYTTSDLVALKRNKGRIKKYDVFLNSTGYVTIGRCQAWLEDAEAIVYSQVTILRPKEQLDPVFLAVLLNSRLGHLQTERTWTGSSGQIELRREAIEDFKVLVAPLKAQHVIRADIEAAHSARSEAKRLWLKATRAMETSILGEDR